MATNETDLFCYLVGNDFPVLIPIALSCKVGALQLKIKSTFEGSLKGVDPGQIAIWKVSLLEDDDLARNAARVAQDKKAALKSTRRLDSYFEDNLEGDVHIVAKSLKKTVAPTNSEDDEVNNLLKAFNTTLQHGLTGPAPSSLTRIDFLANKNYKYNNDYLVGRPIEDFGLPIGLYHPVFNAFQRGLVDESIDDLPAEFFTEVQELFAVASDFYSNEAKRSTELRPILNSLLEAVIERSQNPDNTSSDGAIDVRVKGDVLGISLIEEEKNEIGLGMCDPSLQAGRSYLRRWSQDLYTRARNTCCCPSFLVAIAGPWMCVLGAVLTDKVIAQPLTDYVWLGGNHYDTENFLAIGRLFRSLARGLKDLDGFYKGLSQTETSPQARMFPYIRSFSIEGKEVHFSYLSPLSGRKPVFLAQLDDETKVVVKFVQRYSSTAHILLAAEQLAPRLLYCGSDDPSALYFGRLRMVVMEYIAAPTVHDAIQEGKVGLGVYESVERSVKLLHQHDFVFGDLRPANIMMTSQDSAMLVDFDWCSIEGQGRYPPNLNMFAAAWHTEVRANGVMMKTHDLSLLNAFKLKCY